MFRAKPILGFLCRFVLVFGLLVVPWPGWPETYARCLQKCATLIYGLFPSKCIVVFDRNPSGDKTLDTIICVANRAELDANQQGLVMRFPINSQAVAYFPTALMVALVLATDIGWRRRLCALVWGLVWIHVFIAFLSGLIVVSIICVSPALGLLEISPFWQKIVLSPYKFFVAVGGAPFAIAMLIWIVVTFRREDWIHILCKKETNAEKPAY